MIHNLQSTTCSRRRWTRLSVCGFIAIMFVMALLPMLARAADQQFYEFAPGNAHAVEIPIGMIATQSFHIINNSIDGVDIWADNTGSAGTATVSLIDSNNAVLITKIVSIGFIAPSYTGQQVHVGFGKNISVGPQETYTLKIVSAMAKLRLYVVNRADLLEHNASYIPDTIIGATTLYGDPQNFVFKFALYEGQNTNPPIIANVTTAPYGSDIIRVSYNANELVDRMVSYAIVGSGSESIIPYAGYYSTCAAGVYTCIVDLDVARNSQYTYRLSVKDSFGNESHYDGSFAGPTVVMPTPPAQSQQPSQSPGSSQQPTQQLAISNAKTAFITNSSAAFYWETNAAADSKVTVSTDLAGTHVVATLTDVTQELVHYLGITGGLNSDVVYYAAISSHAGGGAGAATTLAFTTAKQTVTPQSFGQGGEQQVQAQPSGDGSSLTISWGGASSSGYRVDIFDAATRQLVASRDVPSGARSVTIGGLGAGTYAAIVYAKEAKNGIMKKIAEPTIATIGRKQLDYDTYALIKKPIVFIPFVAFIVFVGGLYWYSKKRKGTII